MNRKTNSLTRDTGPELLRIVGMFLIMFHHFAQHGGLDYTTFSISNAYLSIIEFGGKIGVNIFILITGYFSCSSQFSLKKLFKLIFAVEFYSVLLLVLSILTGAQDLSIMLLIKGFFPLLFGNGYWFVTLYIILYCISPILNAGISKVSNKNLLFIIIFLLMIYCVLPNTIGALKQLNDFGFSNIVWFIVLYLLGGYFRRYSSVFISYPNISFPLLVFSIITMLTARTIQLYIGIDSEGIAADLISIMANIDANAIMPFIISVLAFCAFLRLKFEANSLFFDISKATFGVYLIHDNLLFRKYMWESLIQTKNMYESFYFIPLSILSVLILYMICSLIEIFREKFIEKRIFSNFKVCAAIFSIEKRII